MVKNNMYSTLNKVHSRYKVSALNNGRLTSTRHINYTTIRERAHKVRISGTLTQK